MKRVPECFRRHRRALEIIAANPQKFIGDIDSSVKPALEIPLPERGRILTETDIRLIMANGDIHIIEYKSNSNYTYRKRAKRQLEKARGWYRRNMGFTPEQIHTHVIFGDDPRYSEFFREL